MSKNSNDNGNLRSADTVICDGLKVIKNEKNTAHSNYEAYNILQASKQTARAYKICGLGKAEESHDTYQDLMTFAAIGSSKKTEIIGVNIDALIKKDDEIEKLIKDSSKMLNEMKLKIEDAHNAACAMSNCIKNKVLSKSGKKTNDSGAVEVGNDLKKIMQITKELDEKGQNAFESVVTLAGIQTFTNTVSLKDFSKQLTEAMKNFKTCVEENIKSTATDVADSQVALNTIIEELAEVACNKKAEMTTGKGLHETIHYVCEGDYKDECLDLCKDIKHCFDDDDDSDGPSYRKKQSKDEN